LSQIYIFPKPFLLSEITGLLPLVEFSDALIDYVIINEWNRDEQARLIALYAGEEIASILFPKGGILVWREIQLE